MPDARGDAPVNVFSHARAFARPQDRAVVAPNVDTLYSITHLDLGRGPVVLAHPGMGRRYFSFELLDPYTNVIGYVGSRTTGARAGRFAIAWSGRRNHLPRGVRLLRSAYRRLWVVGRTLVHGDADLAAARRAMRGYSLTPLDGAGRPLPVHRPSRIVRRPRTAPVLTGLAFLDALTDALAENPAAGARPPGAGAARPGGHRAGPSPLAGGPAARHPRRSRRRCSRRGRRPARAGPGDGPARRAGLARLVHAPGRDRLLRHRLPLSRRAGDRRARRQHAARGHVPDRPVRRRWAPAERKRTATASPSRAGRSPRPERSGR